MCYSELGEEGMECRNDGLMNGIGYLFQEATSDGISKEPDLGEVEERGRAGDAGWHWCWGAGTETMIKDLMEKKR